MSRPFQEGFVHLYAKIRFFPDGLINLSGGLYVDRQLKEALAEISHDAYVIENKKQGKKSQWNKPYEDLPDHMKFYNRRMVEDVLKVMNFSFDEQRLIRTHNLNEEQVSYALGMAWASWIYSTLNASRKFAGIRTSVKRKIWRKLKEQFFNGARKALESADGGKGIIQRREYPF